MGVSFSHRSPRIERVHVVRPSRVRGHRVLRKAQQSVERLSLAHTPAGGLGRYLRLHRRLERP